MGLYQWQFDRIRKHVYQCSYCGKEVRAAKSWKRNGGEAEHIFCGRACYDNFRRMNSDRICRHCGKHFAAVGSKKRAQFCNDACRRAYFAQKTLSYCVNCGQAFYPWSVDRIRGAVILDKEVNTCCEKCKREHARRTEEARREKISLAFTGSRHPNWQGGENAFRGGNWAHQRFLARERDGNTCQCCGLTKKQSLRKYHGNLEVHHKVPYIFFGDDFVRANDLSNLITLCKSCHQKYEWRYRSEHEDAYKKIKAD